MSWLGNCFLAADNPFISVDKINIYSILLKGGMRITQDVRAFGVCVCVCVVLFLLPPPRSSRVPVGWCLQQRHSFAPSRLMWCVTVPTGMATLPGAAGSAVPEPQDAALLAGASCLKPFLKFRAFFCLVGN